MFRPCWNKDGYAKNCCRLTDGRSRRWPGNTATTTVQVAWRMSFHVHDALAEAYSARRVFQTNRLDLFHADFRRSDRGAGVCRSSGETVFDSPYRGDWVLSSGDDLDGFRSNWGRPTAEDILKLSTARPSASIVQQTSHGGRIDFYIILDSMDVHICTFVQDSELPLSVEALIISCRHHQAPCFQSAKHYYSASYLLYT